MQATKKRQSGFILLSILFAQFFALSVKSQINIGGTPLGFKNSYNSSVVYFQCPTVNVDSLRIADKQRDQQKDLPYRFAYAHKVVLNISNSGTWTHLPNGGRMWRLGIYSAGAASLNLIFSKFKLAEGSRLFIYNADKTEVLGAFTAANNRADQLFSTTLISGDNIIVELDELPNSSLTSELELASINHAYRKINLKSLKSYGQSGSCNMNVNCPTAGDWQQNKRAVALIVVNGVDMCSGSLLNDVPQDTIPYFMTANHCLGSNVATWVFVFNWESPGCANQNIPRTQAINGAVVRAHDSASDFALLELSSKVPLSYSPFFAGWDHSFTPADSVACIHHPSGDIKKITMATNATFARYDTAGTTYIWEVGQWTSGVTEPGSSGSPLYNQDKRFVGQLWGGPSFCGATATNLTDYYGRFSYSWDSCGTTNALKAQPWLDPMHTNTAFINGFDPSGTLNDIGATHLAYPANDTVCSDNFYIQTYIKNYGADSVFTFQVNYQIDFGTMHSYNWSGLLLPSAQKLITIPTLGGIPNGTHTLTIATSQPNGHVDLQASNDAGDTVYFTKIYGNGLHLQLHTDNYGDETSWKIINSATHVVVAAEGNYNPMAGGELIQKELCLPNGCYQFRIYDAYHDGICDTVNITNNTCGYFVLRSAHGDTLAKGSQFQDSLSFSFCVNGVGISLNKPMPTMQVYPNPAKDIVFVKGLGGLSGTISLYNSQGQLEYSLSQTNFSPSLELRMGNFANGIYLLRFENQTKQQQLLKFVKQ